jgi:hypothetical protein
MRHLFASLLQWIKSGRAALAGGDTEQDRGVTLDQLGATLTVSEDLLAGTAPLEEADFTLIGKFIQIYCYSDLNARRIIDTMRFARTGQEEEFASKLNETDVLLHLKRCAETWVGPEPIGDGIRRAVATLEMHRVMRNNFAHWAMRRTADGVGYVMLTMQVGEVMKRGQNPHDRDAATWCLVMRRRVVEETLKLNGHGEYLASLAAHLHLHRAELRSRHLAAAGGNATPSPP